MAGATNQMESTAQAMSATAVQTNRQAATVAAATGVLVVLLGQATLRFLGVRFEDFQIAGGILLLILSLHDLLSSPAKAGPSPIGTIGAVPLGTPLIVGPAALATLALLLQNHGVLVVLVAFGANMVSALLYQRLGQALP